MAGLTGPTAVSENSRPSSQPKATREKSTLSTAVGTESQKNNEKLQKLSLGEGGGRKGKLTDLFIKCSVILEKVIPQVEFVPSLALRA